ncbi:hypothetical protein EIM92_16935 [Paenibacillus lentus]|uniref:Prolipoprotein diacylglyceryl transferase n=1 Tax=Paenibacillus lentus TaxID=1338368 RepID=A0A3S8RWU0_9BACL|nr:hypothetical protein EIM92_16935 [Paenibacillus lentus]
MGDIIGTIALGSLVLRADLLIFLLSAAFGYIVLKIKFRHREAGGWIKEGYVNALGIGFFLWKFSMLFFSPLETLSNPLSLLYFTGGQRGVWLGVLGAITYLAYRGYKNRPLLVPFVKAALLAYGAVQGFRFTMFFLWEGAVGWENLLCAVLAAGLGIMAWLKYESPLRSFLPLALWYSIGSAVIPFLDEYRHAVLIGFSLEQLFFLLVAISLLFLDSFIGNKR